jgi:hypothetical protein
METFQGERLRGAADSIWKSLGKVIYFKKLLVGCS